MEHTSQAYTCLGLYRYIFYIIFTPILDYFMLKSIIIIFIKKIYDQVINIVK